jgi:aldose sugar dehydrogenase
MRTPVVLVAAALTIAILLAASFLIATGTRGEDAPLPLAASPAGQIRSPAGK